MVQTFEYAQRSGYLVETLHREHAWEPQQLIEPRSGQ